MAGDVDCAFFLGQKFNDFTEFKRQLDQYELQKCTKFSIGDCRSIENANKGVVDPKNYYKKSFKYSRVRGRYRCKHGGEPTTRSTGKRPQQRSFKLQCKSGFLLTADRKNDCLIISQANWDHSHPTEKSTYSKYPEVRRLMKEEEELGRVMYSMSVPPKAFRETLMKVSGKMLTPSDVNNLKSRLKKEVTKGASDVSMLMETLDKILLEKPGSYVRLTIDEETGKIKNLFIQLPFMKEAITKFPEVLLLDATYRVNSTKMPLFTLMVEDGYGCSLPVAHFFVGDECTENLDCGFAALKASVGEEILKKNRVFLVDKDFTEIAVVKRYFPHSPIHLCLFHVFKTFGNETKSCSKSGENKKSDVLILLEKMAFATTEIQYEKLYTELQRIAPAKFLQYFSKNWHGCRQMWVSAWRKQTVTFGNRTTNRLESFHQKLKTVMKSSDSLASCVQHLCKFSHLKELEVLHKKFICLTSVSYCATSINETTRAIYASCTPYAAKQTSESYSQMKHLNGQYVCEPRADGFDIRHVTRNEPLYKVNSAMDSCTCTFSSCMLLPCKHIFFVRQQGSTSPVPLFTDSLVSERWKKTYQMFVYDSALLKPTVSVVSVLKKSKENKALNWEQKYSRAHMVFKDIASSMAQHGQKKFEEYMGQINNLRDVIVKGREFHIVEVVPEQCEQFEKAGVTNTVLCDSNSVSSPCDNINNVDAELKEKCNSVSSPCDINNVDAELKESCNNNDSLSNYNLESSDIPEPQVLNKDEKETCGDLPDLHLLNSVLGCGTNSKDSHLFDDIPATFSEMLKDRPDIHLPIKLKVRGRPKGSTNVSKKSVGPKKRKEKAPPREKKKVKKSVTTETVKDKNSLERRNRFVEQCKAVERDVLDILYEECLKLGMRCAFSSVKNLMSSKVTNNTGAYSLLNTIHEDEICDTIPYIALHFKDKTTDVDVLMLLSSVLVRAFEYQIDPLKMVETLKMVPSHMDLYSTYATMADTDGKDDINLYVGNNSLRRADLITLEPEGLLNDQVVHAYLDTLSREVNAEKPNSVYVLPSFLAVKWEKNDTSSWLYKRIELEQFKWVLLPICTNHHWVLLVADMVNHSVGVLDSLDLPDKRFELYLTSWRSFMVARGTDDGAEWTLAKYKCSKQNDNTSCGVFVIMNAEALLKQVPPCVMRQFHCDVYRRYILGKLLTHAKANDEVICDLPFCNKPSGEDIQWLQCDHCNRWFHNQCVAISENPVVYKCLFCMM